MVGKQKQKIKYQAIAQPELMVRVSGARVLLFELTVFLRPVR